MSDTTVTQNPSPGGRWWLPVLLALVILAILAVAFLVTHPHVFGKSATATPTATATSSPTPSPTATPKTIVVTATPGPSPTPGGPTATPSGATATPGGSALKTGIITHPTADIDNIQRQVNRKNAAVMYYLDPFQVVQHNLSAYGFSSFTIVQPATPPAATPTPYTNAQHLPQVRIIVQYQGQRYGIFLDQPVQQGAGGIWVIIAIRPCVGSGTSYCR